MTLERFQVRWLFDPIVLHRSKDSVVHKFFSDLPSDEYFYNNFPEGTLSLFWSTRKLVFQDYYMTGGVRVRGGQIPPGGTRRLTIEFLIDPK